MFNPAGAMKVAAHERKGLDSMSTLRLSRRIVLVAALIAFACPAWLLQAEALPPVVAEGATVKPLDENAAVVRGKVPQSMAIPGDPIREDVELPPLAPIVGKAVNNRYIYGLYVWGGEYLRFRKDIQQVGWKFIRLGGPMNKKIVEVLKADDVQVMYNYSAYQKTDANPAGDDKFIEDYVTGLDKLIQRYDLKNPKFSIECFNEPNFGYMINNSTEAEREALYAKLLPAAYKVTQQWGLTMAGFGAGGAGAGDVRFFKNVHNLNSAVAKSYDVIATHPYVDGQDDAAAPEHYKQEAWGRYSIASCLAKTESISRPMAVPTCRSGSRRSAGGSARRTGGDMSRTAAFRWSLWRPTPAVYTRTRCVWA